MTTSFTIDEEMRKRIEFLLTGTESISQFCQKAAEERINRLEARNERARLQTLAKDKELLKDTVREILKDEGLI